jgi:hypothetical protein
MSVSGGGKHSEGFVVGRFLDALDKDASAVSVWQHFAVLRVKPPRGDLEMNDRANRKHLILRRLLNAPA